jgi:hypothetical protein
MGHPLAPALMQLTAHLVGSGTTPAQKIPGKHGGTIGLSLEQTFQRQTSIKNFFIWDLLSTPPNQCYG